MTMTKKERQKKYGEVFTPEWLVNDMLDMIEGADKTIYFPEKKILEPACGNGNFLVEILRRKYTHCKDIEDGFVSLENCFGIDILPDNVQECRARLLCGFLERFGGGGAETAAAMLERNIVCGDFLTGKYVGSDETIWFLRGYEHAFPVRGSKGKYVKPKNTDQMRITCM